MDQNPYFSVTIPAFKGYFLADCLESVLAQTDRDFEVIVVDDASPENLREIVSRFDDPRIRFYRNEKGFGGLHLTGNWNRCLDYCRGRYMICMGDDDRLLPDCLSAFRKLIAKYPGLGVYHARTQIINAAGTVIASAEARPEYESVYSQLWYILSGNRPQYIGDFLFAVDRLREAGGFYPLPYAWCSDKITALRAAIENGIANTSTFGFQYRQSTLTISSCATVTDAKIEAMQDAHVWFSTFLAQTPTDPRDKEYADLSAKALDPYISHHIWWLVHRDIAHRPSRLFYWLRNRRRIGFTLTDFLRHLALSVRNRLTVRFRRKPSA